MGRLDLLGRPVFLDLYIHIYSFKVVLFVYSPREEYFAGFVVWDRWYWSAYPSGEKLNNMGTLSTGNH